MCWAADGEAVACSWPRVLYLDQRGPTNILCAYQPSLLSSGCVLLSGTMVLPDPPLLKVFKDQELHFLWVFLCVSQQHRYLYTIGCKKSNTRLFYEFTALATHMPRHSLEIYFPISFSLVPALFFCHVLPLLPARLPWHLPLASLVR